MGHPQRDLGVCAQVSRLYGGLCRFVDWTGLVAYHGNLLTLGPINSERRIAALFGFENATSVRSAVCGLKKETQA